SVMALSGPGEYTPGASPRSRARGRFVCAATSATTSTAGMKRAIWLIFTVAPFFPKLLELFSIRPAAIPLAVPTAGVPCRTSRQTIAVLGLWAKGYRYSLLTLAWQGPL